MSGSVLTLYAEIMVNPFQPISLWVCMNGYLWNRTAELHQIFFVRVACGCDLVVLRQRWDMLCTSGFVGDIIISYGGPYAVLWRCVYRVAQNRQ